MRSWFRLWGKGRMRVRPIGPAQHAPDLRATGQLVLEGTELLPCQQGMRQRAKQGVRGTGNESSSGQCLGSDPGTTTTKAADPKFALEIRI
jgi:hypothetical protein